MLRASPVKFMTTQVLGLRFTFVVNIGSDSELWDHICIRLRTHWIIFKHIILMLVVTYRIVVLLSSNCNVAWKVVIDPCRCGLGRPKIPIFTLMSQNIGITISANYLIVPRIQINLLCLGEVDVRSGVLDVSCRHLFNVKILIDLSFRVILQLVKSCSGCAQSIDAFNSHKTSIVKL